MKQYIYATRSGMEIINLEYTIKNLNLISEVMRKVCETNKKIIIVGTSPSTKNVVREFAEKINQPYVADRWLGGTLTNFKIISARVKEYNKLIEDRESGALNKYTKKERVVIDKQIAKMKILFEGIRAMSDLPGALFVLDIQTNMTAVREAKQLGIPVIALINTDINPEIVDYALPGNNRLQGAVSWILSYFEPSLKPKVRVQI